MARFPQRYGTTPPAAPAVSVVMPVHNALPYLDAAVESILGQSFTDFEFVILDDASTDGSTERLRWWARRDSRIRLLEVADNLGPALSSDHVARAARAPIVARMDADDISMPDRLARQVDALARWPEVGVVGGLFELIDHQGRLVRKADPWRLVHATIFPPFGNGPMTYRRALFERVGGYRKACEYWEDLDLLLRLSAVTKVMVLPEALYRVRLSQTSTRMVSDVGDVEQAFDLAFRANDCIADGRDYEPLLRRRAPATGRLDPRVFTALGSLALWAGQRPRTFRQLLRSGRIGFNRRSATALVWGGWAFVAPATLRAFVRAVCAGRNSYARTRSGGQQPVLWSPGKLTPVEDAGEARPAQRARSAAAAS